jgi:hypothetical protein
MALANVAVISTHSPSIQVPPCTSVQATGASMMPLSQSYSVALISSQVSTVHSLLSSQPSAPGYKLTRYPFASWCSIYASSSRTGGSCRAVCIIRTIAGCWSLYRNLETLHRTGYQTHNKLPQYSVRLSRHRWCLRYNRRNLVWSYPNLDHTYSRRMEILRQLRRYERYIHCYRYNPLELLRILLRQRSCKYHLWCSHPNRYKIFPSNRYQRSLGNRRNRCRLGKLLHQFQRNHRSYLPKARN